MKHHIQCFFIFIFIFSIFCCKSNNDAKIRVFMQEYIETVSVEHKQYKTNVTDKMTAYFYDDENKENADLPEFLLMGPFRNDILIVKNYDIQKVRKLPCKDIDRYSVNVQFTIYFSVGSSSTGVVSLTKAYALRKLISFSSGVVVHLANFTRSANVSILRSCS